MEFVEVVILAVNYYTQIDDPLIMLSLINFKINKYSVRNSQLFYDTIPSFKYVFSPINILLRTGNNNDILFL